jgi:predicted XRE-type DNA-binding protein
MKNESNGREISLGDGESRIQRESASTIETEERWLPVAGYEGRYEVSDLGRVRSLLGETRVLAPLDNGAGYKQYSLCRAGGKIQKVYAHKAVLEAFVGPRPHKYHACHEDNNRANNRLDNLRWDTCSNNHADKRKHGTNPRGESHMWSKLSSDSVIEIKRLLREGRLSQPKIASMFGVQQSHVSAIKMGKAWAHLKIEEFDTA